MKATKEFRDQIGLSQEMMAMYLGITKSQLAMYETNKRELPLAALTKLASLALLLNQNNLYNDKAEIYTQQNEAFQFFVTKQIAALQYYQLKEQRLLDKMQCKFQQNIKLKAVAKHLEQTQNPLANLFLQQSNLGLEAYGLTKQNSLTLKLKGIKSQLDYCQTLKKK